LHKLWQTDCLTLAKDIERRYMIPLRVPNTWLHFNAIARYFTRSYNPDSPVEFGHSMASSNPDLFMCDLMPRIWEYGGGFFDRQGRISMASSANIKATRSLLESVLYASPGLLDNKPANAVQDFISGRTAFLYTFYNYVTGLVDGIHSRVANDFSYARLPGNPVMSGWCLGISARSKKSDSAFKFIHWASGANIAIPHTILGGQSPNLMVYRNYDMVSLYPWLPLALQEFEKSRPRLPYMVSDAAGRRERVLDEDAFANCLYRHVRPLVEQAATGHLPALEDFHNLYAEVNREFRP
jgi:multiple sugar transport system substrate-binding protein